MSWSGIQFLIAAFPPPADAAHTLRIHPDPPNSDGWTEKRFPPTLAGAFGEFAPRADSGLREAAQVDAGGSEPRENRPLCSLIVSGGIIPCS